MQTFFLDLSPDAWTLVVDTATHKGFGIQVNPAGRCAIASGTDVPALTSNDWFELSNDYGRELSLGLTPGVKIYARCLSSAVATQLRGYRIPANG